MYPSCDQWVALLRPFSVIGAFLCGVIRQLYREILKYFLSCLNGLCDSDPIESYGNMRLCHSH